MVVKERSSSKVTAVVVIVLIVATLVAWEWFGPGSQGDGGVREVAVILSRDEPYPPVLYVEKGTDYTVAITASEGRHSLERWPGEVRGERRVGPDEVVYVHIPAGELKDGAVLGDNGPVVRVVDSLDLLVARGEIYYVGVIAGEDGLIPRQVRLTEGLRADVGGVSVNSPRMLLIEGARLYLPLYPQGVARLLVDVPGPGTYNLACEQGCEENRWQGALRVEPIDSDVPWVEARDTEAAAEVNKRAPDFALYDVDGRVIQLSDFQGEKPVFINFWATWCPPCEREMPAMQALHEERGDEVQILAVNYLENRTQVKTFIDEMQVDFTVLLDVRGGVNSRYGVWSYPTSVFVDRDGIVRGRFIGELTAEMMEEFVAVITE